MIRTRVQMRVEEVAASVAADSAPGDGPVGGDGGGSAPGANLPLSPGPRQLPLDLAGGEPVRLPQRQM
jgi:hypothetical protein